MKLTFNAQKEYIIVASSTHYHKRTVQTYSDYHTKMTELQTHQRHLHDQHSGHTRILSSAKCDLLSPKDLNFAPR